MKSKSNFWEWLGAGIMLCGLVVSITSDLTDYETGFLPYLDSHNKLFYWGGMLVFAFGYIINPKRKKGNQAA